MSQFPKVRMRRRRQAAWLRETFAETTLAAKDFILALFITDGSEIEVPNMPGIRHINLDSLVKVANEAYSAGIQSLLLFPVVPMASKTNCAKEAWASDNLICRAISEIKTKVPEIGVIVDVALDPYTSHGHDGLVNQDGEIDNDATLVALCKQAVALANAGADVVAPSDMMDGRVAAIRSELDQSGHSNVLILSYAAKYNSKLYAPFRGAIGSARDLGKKDKSSYQQDIRNSDEAVREIMLDVEEGADWLMIKPGMSNLDIIYRARQCCLLPIVAYQVSGEYSMIAQFAQITAQNFLDIQYEFLVALKRAGARQIVCYNALSLVRRIKNDMD